MKSLPGMSELLQHPMLVCTAFILLSLIAFAPLLEHYPEPYFDDAFLNQPAIRVHDGQPFAAPISPGGPYGSDIWAYHSPFFPWMQVLTFRLLGVSQFACRIPQCLCAGLALLSLTAFLIRRQLSLAAIVLAVAWIGDRALLESLYGRMDGIALLFLACTFVSIDRAITTGWRLWALSGFFLGIAVCFHPVSVFFALALIYSLVFMADRRRLLLNCLSVGLGLAVPLSTIVLAYGSQLGHAYAQFRYHHQLSLRAGLFENMSNLIHVIRSSRYWVIALFAVTLFILIPLVLSRGIIRPRIHAHEHRVSMLAALFSISGLLAVTAVSAFPYYLIYFTVWPVIAFMASYESGLLPKKLAIIIASLLFVAWCPSLAWNAMRFRGAAMHYNAMGFTDLRQSVRNSVPDHTPVYASPELFIGLRSIVATRQIYSAVNQIDASAYLVLTNADIEKLGGASKLTEAHRVTISSTPLYPQAPTMGGRVYLVSPAGD